VFFGFLRKWCAKRLVSRAQQFLDAGSLRQAADCARESVAMAGANLPGLMVLGTAQLRMEHYAEAAETFTAALQLDPDNATAKGRLAMACAKSKKWDEVSAAVNDLAERQQASAANRAGDIPPDSLRTAAAPSTERPVISGRDRLPARTVADMIRAGDWEDLRVASEAALLKNPSNPNALMQLGMALYRLGETEYALEAYDKALACVRREPDKAVVTFNRATVLMQMGRWEEACRSFESIAALPDDIRGRIKIESVLYNLAYCYRKRHMIRMALATYERLNELAPGYKDVAKCLRSLRVPLAARAAVPEEETGSITCGNCGEKLPLGATFCNCCGWNASGEEHAAVRLEP